MKIDFRQDVANFSFRADLQSTEEIAAKQITDKIVNIFIESQSVFGNSFCTLRENILILTELANFTNEKQITNFKVNTFFDLISN